MSYFRQQLEDWLKNIDVKADRVLDIGGGSNPVKGRTKSWKVKKYSILDNKLEKMKAKIDFEIDLNKNLLTQIERTDLPQFDVIFCLEVMEYIWDPVQALKNMYLLLKKEGVLYISFPFIYPHHNPFGCDYLRYTRWGAIKLLKETEFRILNIKSRTEKKPNMLESFYAKEGMHMCKIYDKHNEIGYLIKVKKI